MRNDKYNIYKWDLEEILDAFRLLLRTTLVKRKELDLDSKIVDAYEIAARIYNNGFLNPLDERLISAYRKRR